MQVPAADKALSSAKRPSLSTTAEQLRLKSNKAERGRDKAPAAMLS